MTPVKTSDLHVALLRGINVGGKNRLPMAELRELFVEAGCRDVQTYIQSGNVVYRVAGSAAGRISRSITAAIADRFGLQIPVVTRTARELARVAGTNPFLAEVPRSSSSASRFIAEKPSAVAVKGLAQRSPEEPGAS